MNNFDAFTPSTWFDGILEVVQSSVDRATRRVAQPIKRSGKAIAVAAVSVACSAQVQAVPVDPAATVMAQHVSFDLGDARPDAETVYASLDARASSLSAKLKNGTLSMDDFPAGFSKIAEQIRARLAQPK